MIRPAELIQRKRDGGELSSEEIAELMLAYARDEVPDYQMAAFCMAVYFQGLNAAETHALTDAMVRSGETVDLSPLGRKVVDKHSTGGVGDKTSIALGPVVAACGVPFAKMSGRGLGHTGGTLDKLEAIPGFNVELAMDTFLRQVAQVGMAIIGQTGELVPADKRLYALRDVTATVDIIALIASSIMSKKIAGGADALEIREAVDTLRGEGPEDLVELVLGASGHLLALSDLGVDQAEGRHRAEEALASGAALELYERWVRAQGGDPAVAALPAAPVVRAVPAPEVGFVQGIAATAIGEAALRLGAGRVGKEDEIDHSVGIVCLAKRGDRVEAGSSLAEVHARSDEAAGRALQEVTAAYRLGPEQPERRPIVLDVIA